MTGALRKSMTQAEFLDWAQAQEGRYAFDGVGPVAMTGGFGNHARIIGNIAFALRRRLGDAGPCEVLAWDAGIRTVGDAVRYPDVLVTCSGFDGRERLVPDPVIVFEVVSPSSIREDRILKPADYAAMRSIKRYVLVEQSVVGLTVLWRDGDEPWHFQTLKAGDAQALLEIGIEVADLRTCWKIERYDGDQSSPELHRPEQPRQLAQVLKRTSRRRSPSGR